jgi:hypothetical protein
MARRPPPKHYQWPEIQLNIWILTVLAASCICLGIFAWFISVQNELRLGVPWYVLPLPPPSFPPIQSYKRAQTNHKPEN